MPEKVKEVYYCYKCENRAESHYLMWFDDDKFSDKYFKRRPTLDITIEVKEQEVNLA